MNRIHLMASNGVSDESALNEIEIKVSQLDDIMGSRYCRQLNVSTHEFQFLL